MHVHPCVYSGNPPPLRTVWSFGVLSGVLLFILVLELKNLTRCVVHKRIIGGSKNFVYPNPPIFFLVTFLEYILCARNIIGYNPVTYIIINSYRIWCGLCTMLTIILYVCVYPNDYILCI